MDGEDGIGIDPLAVGLTRPSTILGAPYPAVVLNMMVSVEALVWTQDVLWLAICLPIHGICYLVTLNDPRAFELLVLWMRTTLGTLLASRWYWSASSYSPLAFRRHPGLITRWRKQRCPRQET